MFVKSTIKLGRVFGIEIGVHYSWFVIAVLIALGLAGHFRQVNSDWGTGLIWSAAIVTAILFFAGVLVHELAHSVVAISRGGSVRAITLFALGGMAQIERDVKDASTEFLMAIAGPLTSVAIGFICVGLAMALGWHWRTTPWTPPMAVLAWLGYINITLGIFNMIPGFPLDGGRVLRAILWWITKNQERATNIAATVGQVVAALFVLYGIWGFFTGQGFGGLWLALIGWFLWEAARSSMMQMRMVSRLAGIRVADVMARDCQVIDSRTSLLDFVQQSLMGAGDHCYVVKDAGYVLGLISPRDVGRIAKDRWPTTQVREAMLPLNQVKPVSPEMPLADALETMGSRGLFQVPVVSGNDFQGVLSRGHILRVLQSRADLKI